MRYLCLSDHVRKWLQMKWSWFDPHLTIISWRETPTKGKTIVIFTCHWTLFEVQWYGRLVRKPAMPGVRRDADLQHVPLRTDHSRRDQLLAAGSSGDHVGAIRMYGLLFISHQWLNLLEDLAICKRMELCKRQTNYDVQVVIPHEPWSQCNDPSLYLQRMEIILCDEH